MEFSEVIEVLDRGSTLDVQSNCTFESLMIGQKTLEKLKSGQFDRPSPVQAKAIPVGLLGRDMLVQAKSGTGKTLVFSVLAVENLDLKAHYIQKVIITPTREISTQIKETVRKLTPAGARTSVYTGGIGHKLNVIDLKKTRPQIVIGTPGRVAQLIRMGAMDISHVDFFVLDEADKLMDEVFKPDINTIINSLPPIRQVAVFSATYPRNLDLLLSTFLRDAALVRFNQDDVQLVGIKQYVVPNAHPMLETLTRLLKSIRYVQALVFCDQISKCEPIATHLKSEGLDSTHVSSGMSQKDRQLAVDQLRAKRVKILVSSDLTARGIDADNVNLVVNVDAAANEETYFHRIGRAARFGAHGAAITLLEDEKVLKGFTALAYRGRVTVKRVGDVDSIPADVVKNQEFWNGLPWFIKLEDSKKDTQRGSGTSKNDLDSVPDRQEALENLQKARGDSESSYKYDRDQMMSLKRTEKPRSLNFDPRLSESPSPPPKTSDAPEKFNPPSPEESTSSEPSQPVDPDALPPKKSFKERLAELKKAKAEAKNEQKTEKAQEEVKTKFKNFAWTTFELIWTISTVLDTFWIDLSRIRFVPTREKAKKKYYMRGELQHIRDSFSAEQWRAFAESKYDLSQEPFLDAFGASGNAENGRNVDSGAQNDRILPENTKKSGGNVARNGRTSPKSDSGAQNGRISPENDVKKPKKPTKKALGIIQYNRHELKNIQKAIPKESWIPYVKSRYDTSEEPWELDPWLRCPFEERLRRIRKREKDERKKVIEERKKKRDEDRSELVSIGKVTQKVEIRESSWADYQARVQRDFMEFVEKRDQEEKDGTKKQQSLRRIGPVVPERGPPHIYNYRVDMYKRRLAEQDAWLMQETKLEDGKIQNRDVQTEDSKDVVKSYDVGGKQVLPEVSDSGIQTDEVRILDSDSRSQEEEEYRDDEEEYWDEEEDPEDVRPSECRNFDIPNQQQFMRTIGERYRQNVNMQASMQSYIDLMNSITRNFS
ncbi:Protein CBR-MEL-46 [Caenorhabditis briggsae]|uniref:Protein CBR-MEL-46 n=1 Tax=Caenorhabditis briggsae TaxID=6238 RepID=A8XIH3_CAEBR|nr:Protein CBR-MEL-46 [Caenorhabditis briggsae]CAP32447.2 Protein CBR-MEL-46 [Caenorhabditis briggsae]